MEHDPHRHAVARPEPPVDEREPGPIVFTSAHRPLWAYAWSAPTTALGLVAGALTLLTGGSVRCRSGVLEFHRAFSRALLESPRLGASAVTLGHVILARDEASLEPCLAHEYGHVRQAELLGPFFLIAYGLAALWAGIRHGAHYDANWLERDADRRAGLTPRGVRPGRSRRTPTPT